MFYRMNVPVIIATHSKSGPAGWALNYMIKNHGICKIDSIHAFAPARGIANRYLYFIDNATMYIDNSDPVPKLGRTVFQHPTCNVFQHPEIDSGIDISDHGLNHWDGVV
jgi:hypothetical protein